MALTRTGEPHERAKGPIGPQAVRLEVARDAGLSHLYLSQTTGEATVLFLKREAG
jgi:hypothetical protein